ncbi:MAG: hypothetical protein QOG63_1010 [Thermoleophilaceae bacterium]|jgi:hypothetical protein|nr:hypothetical protein [Thermoleophilaceae bacterium]
MSPRRGIHTLVAVALVALLAAPSTVDAAAKKHKVPCDFKLSRNKAHHDRVKIKMTCHRKFVVNVRFKLRKKYTASGFDGFPGAICSVQSARVVGCVFGGNGAPVGKPVAATVHTLPPAPRHDAHFAHVVIFISGGDSFGELLAY